MHRSPANVGYRYAEAVGGIVPGYVGHRPGAQNVHGETAFGGVSQTLESDRPPGQGWSVESRSTTSHDEVGREYKPHTRTEAEVFRRAVNGVKSGYAGHTPGAREHFGSSHQGDVPLDDFRSAQAEAKLSSPDDSRFFRGQAVPFVPAAHVAQASGTLRQRTVVQHGVSNVAPFGVDEHTRYATESSRTTGAREQSPTMRLDLRRAGGHADTLRPTSGPLAFRSHHPPELFDHEPHHGRGISQRDQMPGTPPRMLSSSSRCVGSAPPRGGQPPREQRPPSPDMPAVGYSGHRIGERDLSDNAIRRQVESYNHGALPHGGDTAFYQQTRHTTTQGTETPPRTPPPSNRPSRPTVVGDKSLLPATPTTATVGAKHASRQRLAHLSHSTPSRGSAATTSPPPSQRSQVSQRSQPSQRYASTSLWDHPSWEKQTPDEEVYRTHVGGVKLGYSGHIPSSVENVGSSNYGGRQRGVAPVEAINQRGHGTRTQSEHISADRTLSHRAATSAVGYGGHRATEQSSMGHSYWRHRGGPAGTASDRYAGMTAVDVNEAQSTNNVDSSSMDLLRLPADHLLTA
jgi:hypothetical protein